MNTNSDKHGLPPRTSHRLGQESMAFGYGLHVAAGGFPRRCRSLALLPVISTERKPVCINQ